MKKIIAIVIVLIMSLWLLCACSDGETEQGYDFYNAYDGVTMVKISITQDFGIFVHKETKVMYIRDCTTYGGGLTALIDENGKPLLYEGELE